MNVSDAQLGCHQRRYLVGSVVEDALERVARFERVVVFDDDARGDQVSCGVSLIVVEIAGQAFVVSSEDRSARAITGCSTDPGQRGTA